MSEGFVGKMFGSARVRRAQNLADGAIHGFEKAVRQRSRLS
jgi:hypothetical protein